MIFLLPPYFENFGKRAIKTPKLYFCDTGLAAYLLGIDTPTQMERDPLRGALFENLIISELIKTRWNMGRNPRLYFYRDSNQNEVDVLFQSGHQLIPIEIKSSSTFHPSFCKGLSHFKDLVKDRAINPHLIYAGEEEQTFLGTSILHYSHSYKAVLTDAY